MAQTQTQGNMVKLQLKYPTVFKDLNAKKGNPPDHVTEELEVSRMKHKHFRKLQSIPEEEHIHYIMRELTGLSDRDLDELDAEDSAELSELIFNFMRRYSEIAQRLTGQEGSSGGEQGGLLSGGSVNQ
jgi:hypothetical protein